MNRIHSIAAACALFVMGLTTTWAQTAPAAAASAPKSKAQAPSIVLPKQAPAKGGPKTLGGKAANGKMLSRDELRACLKRLDAVNVAAKDLTPRRTALDAEKDEINKSGEPLKAMLVDVNAKLALVREWEARTAKHGTEVEAFNGRMKAAEEMTRSQRDATMPELNAERDRLTKARAEIDADNARLVPAYQAAAKGYNEKVLVRDNAVGDWNERNKALNEQSLKQDEERQAWLTECANRPYREDDETAIKAGK